MERGRCAQTRGGRMSLSPSRYWHRPQAECTVFPVTMMTRALHKNTRSYPVNAAHKVFAVLRFFFSFFFLCIVHFRRFHRLTIEIQYLMTEQETFNRSIRFKKKLSNGAPFDIDKLYLFQFFTRIFL
jgi:hypothetical protein